MKGLGKRLCALGAVVATQVIGTLGIVTGDVATTILILARNQYDADQAASGLNGYGIDYQQVIVPQAGVTLPVLNSTATHGNYGGIITVSELSYLYDPDWHSALTDAQWETLYAYQRNFGVRMVRIDAWPQESFGTDVAIHWDGCCASGVEQKVSLTNDSTFRTANLKLNQGVSTIGLWHVPAIITNSSIATKFAEFEASGAWTTTTVAGVINKISGREQMVWFMTWATDWALGSNYLQHANIHFLTRGLFVGARKIRLNTQIDDVMLETEIYSSTERFRIRTGDLDAHVAWQADINSRMPAGSQYFLELAHNGAGDLEQSGANDPNGICVPDTYVLTDSPPTVPPTEWVKPLGTGTSYWKPTYNSYTWSLMCAKLDPLTTWFTNSANKNAFSHLSHTFTHLHLTNATYSDTNKEIKFNQQWMASIGLNTATKFSPHGLVPPAISGLHNGDAIKAFLDNGIQYVVGDNTRPLLRSTDSPYWPIVTTVANDGYAGLTIIPRWATTIFYNCYSADCTTTLWVTTSGGSGDFNNLLKDARNTNVRNLLSLKQDPFMFHQANLRQTDMPVFTVGPKTGKMSLVQIWVETVVQELTRLTNWPIVTLKHDDIAKVFIDRKARDLCQPRGSYKITSSGTITGLVLTTTGNNCGVPVPVTAPGTSSVSGGGSTLDQVGSEPPIRWVTMSGAAKTITLTAPITI